MSPDLSYICPVNKIITMKRNWIGSSMIVALFALLASGCGHSQRTLEFRGICVDDPQGENGLYNPGRGFRLETAVDVLHEKDTPTEYNTPIYGEWSTKARSLSPIPFTASISGDQLTLKCASPDYDINITIVNANGQSVWLCDIAAPETSFVSIPLDSLPQGSYTIEISNDYGGYLQGTFQL